jgi:hypothetical protein
MRDTEAFELLIRPLALRPGETDDLCIAASADSTPMATAC